MSHWVVVYGQPTRQLYADAGTMAAHGVATDAKHLILGELSELSAALSVDGQVSSSLSIPLRNTHGEALRLFRQPPIGARVEVRAADGVIFAGRVVEVTLDSVAALQVES